MVVESCAPTLVRCRELDAVDVSLLQLSLLGPSLEVSLGHEMSCEAAGSAEGR